MIKRADTWPVFYIGTITPPSLWILLHTWPFSFFWHLLGNGTAGLKSPNRFLWFLYVHARGRIFSPTFLHISYQSSSLLTFIYTMLKRLSRTWLSPLVLRRATRIFILNRQLTFYFKPAMTRTQENHSEDRHALKKVKHRKKKNNPRNLC